MSLRTPLGLALAGYGLLTLAGILPHDAWAAGAVALALGALLLARGLPGLPAVRARLVAALGAATLGGVLLYNALAGSGLTWAEWAIAAYGALLLLAAPRLDRQAGRTDVATLVGWSFPLLLAPLAVYALNAGVSQGSTAAAPLIRATMIVPTALLLRLTGMEARIAGDGLTVQTEAGPLALGIGLVCAGVYPMVLFGGLVALHGWREKVPPRRLLGLLGAGLAALWAVNLVRLAILVRVGARWGLGTLQEVHANLGWALFALFTAAFWAVAMRARRPEPAPDAAEAKEAGAAQAQPAETTA